MSSGIFKDLTGKIFGRLIVKRRILNKFGKVYSIENCVSCCNQCNYGKLDFSEQEFYAWISRLHSNLVRKGVLNV